MRHSTHLSERAAHQAVEWAAAEGCGGTRPAGLVELGHVPFADVAVYDRSIFGAERNAFLRAWTGRDAHHALACLRSGRLAGYAVLRPCREGAKVGPLFADDASAADVLFKGMRAAAGEGTPLFLGVPHANPGALDLARAHLEAPVFETARMYRNGRPPEDLARVFGVTTFELG